MAQIKVTLNGTEIIVNDVDVVDGFAILKFGEYEIKVPQGEWEEVV